MSRRHPFQYQFVMTARRWLAWVAAVIVLGLVAVVAVYVAGDGHWPPRTVHGEFTVDSCQNDETPLEPSKDWLCFGSFRTSPGGALTSAVILSYVRGDRPEEGTRIDAWVPGPRSYVATPRTTGRLVLVASWFKVGVLVAFLMTLAAGGIRRLRRRRRDRNLPGGEWPGWE
jgi:hypothetical protein